MPKYARSTSNIDEPLLSRRPLMWKKTLRALILFVAILTTNCQQPHLRKSVKTLTINFQEGDLPSLHPHDVMIYLRGLSLDKCLYEGLTRINEQGSAELAGAESMELSADRLRYTFTLKENFWSNGDPVLARHYEQAWKAALSTTSPCPRADLLYSIKGAREALKGEAPLDSVGIIALNDRTLQIDLAYPCPHFPKLIAHPVFVPLVNPQEKIKLLFNGPFLVGSWEKNDHLTLKPNPYFWNKNNVALNEIIVHFVQDTKTAYTLFEQGVFDWMGVPLCALTTEQITHVEQTGILYSHPVDRAFLIFLNTQHPTLSSPSIRKALSLALNRSTVTDHILIGGEPLFKHLPWSLLEQEDPNILKEDLAEARELFDHGLKELGLTRATLPPLVFAYSQQAGRKQFAAYVQETWNKTFDINVQLESQEWNTLRTNLAQGNYQMSAAYEAAFYKDPLELLERLSTLSTNNFPHWVLSAFSNKVEHAKREANLERRLDLLKDAEHLLAEHMPFIPVCTDRLLFTHTPHLKGYVFDFIGAIDFSYASFE